MPPRFSAFIDQSYEIHQTGHAAAILKQDFPGEWNDIISVLNSFRLNRSMIVAPDQS